MMGKCLVVAGLFVLAAALSGMCGCSTGPIIPERCRPFAKNLRQAPDGDGDHAYMLCNSDTRLELVVLAGEPIAVCHCPPTYAIDAGTP